MPGLNSEVSYQTRIKNLEDLLQPQIGKEKKVINVEEINFLAKGENFGSTTFRVDITIRDEKTGKVELISTIAKMLPKTEIQRQMFNVQRTVVKEIAFYKNIIPTFINFMTECGMEDVNMFPILYGGRINLNGSDIVDDDSVILLENVIASGKFPLKT